MTCPYCRSGHHAVEVCPERLEERFGVPSDQYEEEDDSDESDGDESALDWGVITGP